MSTPVESSGALAWTALVPAWALEGPAVEWVRATVLVADLAGFTAMSEALGRRGRAGTEELSAVLNGCFGAMVEAVERHGGDVAAIHGDALTALFRGRRAPAARRGLAAGLAVPAVIARREAVTTAAGPFSLSVRCALAQGRVLRAVVGDPALRLEPLVAGRAVARAERALRRARRGEVVAHREMPAIPGVRAAAGRGAFRAVPSVDAPPPRRRPGPGRARAAVATEPGAHLHPALAERLRAGRGALLDEHRRLSVLFCRFANLDLEGDRAAPARLGEAMAEVVRVVAGFDGYLHGLGAGEKGGVFLVLFGAPVAHDDDERRALACAQELRGLRVLAPARIGLHSGVAWCGLVGSAARRGYTALGDAVNVAARLVEACPPRRILASAALAARVDGGAGWTPRGTLSLRGRVEPVDVLEPPRRPAAPSAPVAPLALVGRRAELAAARAALEAATRGRGGVLVVTGDAGIGKSRLARAVAEEGARRGFGVFTGACPAHGGAAYAAWRPVWRALLGVEGRRPAARLRAALSPLGPGAAARAALLAPVLGERLEETDDTRALRGQDRVRALEDLLVAGLRRRAASTPVLLALEDAHWIDPPSAALLARVATEAPRLRVVVLVTRRDGSASPRALGPAARELALAELSAGEVDRLVALKLQRLGAGEDVPDGLRARVRTRAGGNPFFVEELVTWLHERLGAGEAAPDLELPATVESLVMSRIDLLGEGERAALKVASVIGRTFSPRWLAGGFPELGVASELDRRLVALSRHDLAPLVRPEPEREHAFKHAITHELAYESLSFATRAELHGRLARWLEAHEHARADLAELLAHHYGASTDRAKQRVWFRRAGDAARRAYAGEDAARHLRRLVPIVEGPERAGALVDLGEVLQLGGAWDEARDRYLDALGTAETAGDPAVAARARSALGDLLAYTRSFPKAVALLERARADLLALERPAALATVLERLAYAEFQRGEYARARARSTEHLALARELGDGAALSAAEENLGLVAWHEGDLAGARPHLERALAAAAEARHRVGEVNARNDLAGLLTDLGRHAEAMEHLRAGYALAARIGHRRLLGVIATNAGELHRRRGATAAAVPCYEVALDVAGALGDLPTALGTVESVALLCEEEGRGDDAERLLEATVALAAASDNRRFLGEHLAGLARIRAARGAGALAEEAARTALELARSLGHGPLELEATVLLGRLRAATGPGARAAAVGVLDRRLAAEPGDEERAALHYERWRLQGEGSGSRAAAADLYRRHHAAQGDELARRRLEELTGERLAPPPPLPLLAGDLAPRPGGLVRLVGRADEVLEAMSAATLERAPRHNRDVSAYVVGEGLRT